MRNETTAARINAGSRCPSDNRRISSLPIVVRAEDLAILDKAFQGVSLTDARYTVRATLVETRILIARAKGRPHLAYARIG